MKKINVLTLSALSIILFISCSRNLFDPNYKGEANYKRFYVVDSIFIDDPIILSSHTVGGRFVMSKSLLKEFQNNSKFFLRADVFLLGEDLYMDLEPTDYNNYSYPDYGNCKLRKSESEIKDVEVFEYTNNPTHFILGFINVNYYNVKHNSENYYQICEKNAKINYYKIVYPLCK